MYDKQRPRLRSGSEFMELVVWMKDVFNNETGRGGGGNG